MRTRYHAGPVAQTPALDVRDVDREFASLIEPFILEFKKDPDLNEDALFGSSIPENDPVHELNESPANKDDDRSWVYRNDDPTDYDRADAVLAELTEKASLAKGQSEILTERLIGERDAMPFDMAALLEKTIAYAAKDVASVTAENLDKGRLTGRLLLQEIKQKRSKGMRVWMKREGRHRSDGRTHDGIRLMIENFRRIRVRCNSGGACNCLHSMYRPSCNNIRLFRGIVPPSFLRFCSSRHGQCAQNIQSYQSPSSNPGSMCTGLHKSDRSHERIVSFLRQYIQMRCMGLSEPPSPVPQTICTVLRVTGRTGCCQIRNTWRLYSSNNSE